MYFEVPLILFPQTPEQGAVAIRTVELGAGIALKSIEKKDILSAVREAISNNTYKEKAISISKSFKQCGGIKEAKLFLEAVSGFGK